MNSKLTAKLAARYYGCEVVCVSTGFHYVLDADILSAIENGVEYMLVLTPLSAITDEHAEIIGRYRYNDPKKMSYSEIGKSTIKDYLKQDKPKGMFELEKYEIDLLRSLSYDCDNAISEGWAVDRLAFVK
jgi:hypothetical protein